MNNNKKKIQKKKIFIEVHLNANLCHTVIINFNRPLKEIGRTFKKRAAGNGNRATVHNYFVKHFFVAHVVHHWYHGMGATFHVLR